MSTEAAIPNPKERLSGAAQAAKIIWKALGARVSLFPKPSSTPGTLPSAADIYRQAWDASPENFQSSANALAPSIAQGKRAGMTLGCSVHPTRIDFNFMPAPPTGPAPGEEIALIEDTFQLHEQLIRLIAFVGAHQISDSINRVGIFLHFVTVASNIENSNRILIGFIPDEYRVRLTDEEDFVLQINRWRMSSHVSDVKMNYLAKWSTDRLQVFTLPVPLNIPGVGIAAAPPFQSREFVVSSVTLDYNNTPLERTLNREQQYSLLSEELSASEGMQKSLGLNVGGF